MKSNRQDSQNTQRRQALSKPFSNDGRGQGRDPYLWALIALAVLYGVIFTRLAWDLQAGMRTHRSDLGQIDQAIWNSSRGHWLAQTDNGFEATRLTDHVEPILVLISPIYWLWDDVRALLLLQVVTVAAGVLPLYLLALRQCEKLLSARERHQIWRNEPLQQLARPLAFALGVAYLLAPQLQSALLTEFHAAVLAVPLILWAFWSVDVQRWGQFLAAALLVAFVKEEMALLAAGLGLWAAWRAWWEGRQKREETRKREKEEKKEGRNDASSDRSSLRSPGRYFFGAIIFVAGLIWFYIATFVIVPAHAAEVYGAAESTYFQRYGALGNSSTDILKSVVTRPDLVVQIASEPARVAYLAGLLITFAWLPLLGLEIVLLSLPLLLANLLSAYPAQYYGEFHYSAPLVAYFGVAAVYGMGRMWRFLARRLERSSSSFQHLPAQGTGLMAAAAMVQNARTALLPLITAGLVIWVLAWSAGNYLLYGRGPLGGRYDPTPITAHHRLLERFTAQIPADVAVTATAGVHPHVSHRRYVYQFPLGLDAPMPATWALLDVTTNTDMAPGDLKARVDALLAGEWRVVDAADGFLLLAHGQGDKTIPEAFYTFARTNSDVASNAPLQLTAIHTEDWPRWRQTKLVAEWVVGDGYDPATTPPWVELVTPQQDVIATLSTATPPALVWLPPERWQPGQSMRVTTLPLSLPRTVGVRAAGDGRPLTAIFHRQPDGKLSMLSGDLAAAGDFGAALAKAGLGPLLMAETELKFSDGDPARVRVWIEDRASWPGDALDVWVQWGVARWPEPLSAFVHLRRNGETIAQMDGAPAFLTSAPNDETVTQTFLNEWRQVTIPADSLLDGEWTLALGLYDARSGQRIPLASGGDELVVALPKLTEPPIADQACALIPQTCAAR